MAAALHLVAGEPERRCIKCGEAKGRDQFVPGKGVCRECKRAYQRQHYEQNKERLLDQNRARYRTTRGRILRRMREPDQQVRLLINRARARARSEGVPFDLAADDIFIPTHCPVFGIPLRWPCDRGRGGRARPDTASLDRIDPRKGYVRGNVEIISMRANRLKSNATAEEHERIASWMRSRGAQ